MTQLQINTSLEENHLLFLWAVRNYGLLGNHPSTYRVMLTYGSVMAVIGIGKRESRCVVTNDSQPPLASQSDLEGFVTHLENSGVEGSSDVVEFLLAIHDGLKLPELEIVRRQITFGTEHGLEFFAPQGALTTILRNRRDKYVWRRESSLVLGEKVDIAQYHPSPALKS